MTRFELKERGNKHSTGFCACTHFYPPPRLCIMQNKYSYNNIAIYHLIYSTAVIAIMAIKVIHGVHRSTIDIRFVVRSNDDGDSIDDDSKELSSSDEGLSTLFSLPPMKKTEL